MKIFILLILLMHSLPALANWNTTDEDILELEAVEQAESFIKEREREEKILQSLETLDKGLDLLELDRLQQIDSEVFSEQAIDKSFFNEQPVLESDLLRSSLDEEMTNEELIDEPFGDDGFDFLDEEIAILNQEFEQAGQVDSPTTQAMPIDKKSVGIKGKEEALINKLDNSDLMDFEKDIDIWGDDIKVLDDDDGTNGNE